MQELKKVIEEIEKGFVDPFQDGDLKVFLNSGSKCIRSRLAILYLKSLNKEIMSDIYKILAVGEIIHNASLLHDDVLDEATLRREQITIAEKHSSKLSILGGDYLLAFAMNKILELKNWDIVTIFKSATIMMSQAEIKQLLLRGKIPSKDNYIEICKGKTASLFSAILESVALLSDIDSIQAKRFGELFGIVFQIKNDMEENSSTQDKLNKIYTAVDILGIEKTLDLLDNYRQEMRDMIGEFPSSKSKDELEKLIEE